MSALVLTDVARFFLMLVMAVAFTAKLTSGDEFRQLLESANRPFAALSRVWFLVPVSECIAVLALFFVPWIGAVVTLLLLSAFTAFVVGAVAQRKALRCACFGPLSQAVIGPATVVRNLILVMLAALVAVRPPSVSTASFPNGLIAVLIATTVFLLAKTLPTATAKRTPIENET